jgi:hypothetical protein
MFTIIKLILFLVGLIVYIVERINFEKRKFSKSEDYISLYREYNTMMIVLFFALVIDNSIDILT